MVQSNEISYNSDIFLVNTESEDNLKRSGMSIALKSELIDSIVTLINDLKLKFKAYSYLHLRYILKEQINQIDVKEQLIKLSKNNNKNIDYKYIKILFNLIFDMLDSIGGGTGEQIRKKYHIHLDTYSKNIFKEDDEKRKKRFSYNTEKRAFIVELAENVIKGKISLKSFENLLDPYIQELIKYHRKNFTNSKTSWRSAIFSYGKITMSFIEKFLDLNPVTLKKMFNNAKLEPMDIFELTEKLEIINLNDEILKFVIFSILTDKSLNSQEIIKKAGVSRDYVLINAKILNTLKNPLTKSPYINYNKRFSNNRRKDRWEKLPSKSLSGYTLKIPLKEKKEIIQSIQQIIFNLFQKYEYSYFVKQFMNKASKYYNEDQNSTECQELTREYQELIYNLEEIRKKYEKMNFYECFNLFNLVLEVYNYIEGNSQVEIAKKLELNSNYVGTISHIILTNKIEYENRFPYIYGFGEKEIEIANEVISGKISSKEFSNIDSFEFQQLIEAYRKKIVEYETDKVIQEGYPSVGSKEFNRKIYEIKYKKNLFENYFLGSDFINWLDHLKTSELKHIILDSSTVDLKKSLLIRCGIINKNFEILKYLIYLILKSDDQVKDIVKKTGKSSSLVRRIAHKFDETTCPITNMFYLKDYEERFVTRKK